MVERRTSPEALEFLKGGEEEGKEKEEEGERKRKRRRGKIGEKGASHQQAKL